MPRRWLRNRSGEGADAYCAMSDLTPIKPLAFADLGPAEVGSPPTLEWIKLSALRVNHQYQRHLSERSVTLIRSIVRGFDWSHLKPLSVIDLGDGTYEVLDGQHTATAAATHGGIDEVPCYVVGARSLREHAGAFVALNTHRVAVTPLQSFWARVVAGDEIASAVAEAAERADCTILRKPPTQARYRPGDCVAVGALMKVVVAKGVPGCARVLKIARQAQLAPILTEHIKALRALLWSSQYAGTVSDQRLALTLRRDNQALLAEAREARRETRQPLWQALAVAIYRAAT